VNPSSCTDDSGGLIGGVLYDCDNDEVAEVGFSDDIDGI
jgi:hypothetical protein